MDIRAWHGGKIVLLWLTGILAGFVVFLAIMLVEWASPELLLFIWSAELIALWAMTWHWLSGKEQPVPVTEDIRSREEEDLNLDERCAAFNAWLSQVVEDEKLAYKDRALVRVSGVDERLAGRFAELATLEGVRGHFYRAFHALWPVFHARALANAKIPPWRLRGEPREKYRARCFKRPDLRRGSWSPECFVFHQPRGTAPDGYRAEYVPFDWLHTLDAIYQVRCNLFHGGKTFTSSSDAKIVKLSLTILWEVWTTSQAVPEEHLLLKDRRVSIAEGGDHEP